METSTAHMGSEIFQQWEAVRWLWILMAAMLGACVGSFLTMASWRIPHNQSMVLPRSYCPVCDHTLSPRELFPIVSWLVQGRKCAHCGTRIHWRYPLIELITATAFAVVLAIYPPAWSTLLLLILISSVILLIITDLEFWIIPDEVHWVLIPAGVLFRALPVLNMQMSVPYASWATLLIGPVAGLGVGLALRYGYLWIRKRVGLGWGDVKFLATAGAWTGAMGLVPFLFYGGLLGVIFALVWRAFAKKSLDDEDGEGHFPFGPALAISLCIGVFWPDSYGVFWHWPGMLHG